MTQCGSTILFDGASTVNPVRFCSQLVGVTGLVLLCSCATPHHYSVVVPARELPADVAMNKGAGRGMVLFVKVRLESGEEFPCAIDNGSPSSLLPKLLESTLGKPLRTRAFSTLDTHKEMETIYAAPKLYLGKTLLATGSTIGTWDSSTGVLGMDCLCHYCIQLDFEAGKMRFLDPERVNTEELGKAFPLTPDRYAVIRHGGFFDQKSSELLVDTGCFCDAT